MVRVSWSDEDEEYVVVRNVLFDEFRDAWKEGRGVTGRVHDITKLGSRRLCGRKISSRPDGQEVAQCRGITLPMKRLSLRSGRGSDHETTLEQNALSPRPTRFRGIG